jgi:hypothetical protein
MSLCHFQQVSKFLHFANSKARPTECEDRLYKVRPVLNSLVSKLQQVCVPGKQISVDEGMIMWKDWLIFKEYMPDKPDRCGIKGYLVSESKSCFLCNMEVCILANHVKLISAIHTATFVAREKKNQ